MHAAPDRPRGEHAGRAGTPVGQVLDGVRSAPAQLLDGIISSESARTLPGLLVRRVEQTPGRIAYRQFEQGSWRGYTWQDVADRVARWQRGLEGEGLQPGDRVALSLPNGLDWVCFDQAALGLGLVTVPLYTNDSPGNLAHVLEDSGARLLLLDDSERTVGYYLPMMAGSCVSYARSVEQLREDLLAVRPTVILSVPRVYDKIYLAIQAKLGDRGLRRHLLDRTVAVGWQRFEASQARAPGPGAVDRLLWPLLRFLVARPVLKRLGGRLRVAVSGGAPLAPAVAQFFVALGLPLTEGYGLTEAAPVVTAVPPEDFVPGWVGRELDGLQVRLGPGGELFVRGSNLMQGYWNQPEATAHAIDADGWLRTGDLAEIRDGYIGIRGRLKEILVTSTGEKVSPVDMEMALTMDPLFDQAMVVGEGRPYLTALLVLAQEPWGRLASGLGLDPAAPEALNDPRAVEAALSRVADRLTPFPGYAQVRAVHLSLSPWTVENGLITPTMKLKRPELQALFADVIEALYV